MNLYKEAVSKGVLVGFLVLFFASASTYSWATDQNKMKETLDMKNTNRLIHEKSPYLLQHANNPVDWYPWGEEAFTKAREEKKMIFLSIGYSTCHWCHVMEHESFENDEIADIMNKYFVSVKVDREERPDIDNIYMSSVMAMTGRGGWPLSVFLTPDKKPVYGGTYFPPYAKWGSPGFIDLLHSVQKSWTNDPGKMKEAGQKLVEVLKSNKNKGKSKNELTDDILTTTFQFYERDFDSRFGGFGYAPKFPMSHNLSYLLRYYKRTKDKKALEMVEVTLREMAYGGMYDQMGGGFHRYSTDQEWQIPHFEKMLYDQAILARTYLEAYQLTKNEFYTAIAREIFTYVLRDMTDSSGGFYSAEDADSLDPDEYSDMTLDPNLSLEKKEGAFYLWRFDEIKEHLKRQDAEIFIEHFGIKKDGNAKSDPHGEFTGKNVLFVEQTIDAVAKKLKISENEVKESIKKSLAKLKTIRDDRPRPHLDDKILVDWNGLMIAALSYGAQVLGDENLIEQARKAADFIMSKLIDDKGRLLHRYRENEAGIKGSIEDYAFFVYGLMELYEASGDVKYLKEAQRLSSAMMDLFEDKEGGGFYFTGHDAEELLYKEKEVYDGAIPSGNSIAALNLVRLYQITLDKKWEESFEKLFNAFADDVLARPTAYAQLLIAFDCVIGPSKEIVLAGPLDNETINDMRNKLSEYFLPKKVVVYHPADPDNSKEIITLAPFIENQKMLDGKPTAYVCENHRCKLPVNDTKAFVKQLEELE